MAKRYPKKNKPQSLANEAHAPFRRVTISGTLTLKSELHIGSSAVSNTGANEVGRDANGQPYIPGSSLRGALASMLNENNDPDNVYRRLFGLARQADSDGALQAEQADDGGIGLLRVFDACTCGANGEKLNANVEIIERSRTRIEAVTGTAMDHHLATFELVPVGTCFELTILMDHDAEPDFGISDKEIQTVLSLLDGLNEQSLGKGKSIGQGHLQWERTKLEGISEADYRLWLLNNLQQKANAPGNINIKPLVGCSHPLTLLPDGSFQTVVTWGKQHFSLLAQSPILINDPVAVKAAMKEAGDTAKSPNHIFLQRSQDGKAQAVIPGATLKGWFRAQSRRILLTLTQGQDQQKVDDLLSQLFGSTEHGSSLLSFNDALVQLSQNETHSQMFNAVDRFTGGVKDSALFSAEALWTDQAINSGLRFKDHLLKGWMRMLLLYVWNDAKDGDLVLGWGKGKGYGRLMLTTSDDDERSWLENPDYKLCKEWQTALYEALGLSAVEISHE